MTHLEPSGAPAAGRPPPQLEGGQKEKEGGEEKEDSSLPLSLFSFWDDHSILLSHRPL